MSNRLLYSIEKDDLFDSYENDVTYYRCFTSFLQYSDVLLPYKVIHRSVLSRQT